MSKRDSSAGLRWRDRLQPVAAWVLITCTGCTVGPDFQRPKWAAPEFWFSGPRQNVMKVSARTLSTPDADPVDVAWWSLFDDPKLTAMVQRVAGENLDV